MEHSEWLEDQLHEVLGHNDQAITDYLLRLTQTRASKSAVLNEIEDVVNDHPPLRNVISNLWDKIQGK